MGKRLLDALKRLLTQLGSRLPWPVLRQVQAVTNYLTLGRWMREHHFRPGRRVRERNAIFAVVAEPLRERRVLYLEFGVYRGASMRYWSRALKHPDARLHGFDSFDGLPEDFDVLNGPCHKGSFSTDGAAPVIHDSRVQFFKGWFDQVLRAYRPPEHEVLVITLDADLYSSTIYVLRQLTPWIQPGTFIYFDELCRPEHEPKAFDEFMKETGREFELVCADHSLNRAIFKCVA
jgi:hypothetical protein